MKSHMRKITLLLIVLLTFSSLSFAQLQKGNILLGGGVGYSNQNIDHEANASYKSSSFTFSPQAGFFLHDNLALGLNLSYNNHSTTNESGSSTTEFSSSQFGLGPFLRKYFPMGEQFALFGQVDLGYQFGKQENSTGGQNIKRDINALRLGTGLGFSFFPKDWISVDLTINPLSYTHLKVKDDESTVSKTNNFDFSLNTTSLSLGAYFFINRK